MGEFVSNFLCILLHMVQSIVRPFYSLVYYKKPCSIPPVKNPLLKVSATTLARKIRNGELSSQTVVEAYIERIKEVNPFINAVIEDRFEAALNEAKTCDAQLKAGEVVALILEKEKPLYGVPITIKESCSLKGMSFTGCCLKMKDRKASKDGEAAELLKKAGAIPLLVSNTSELCTSVNSFNNLFGQTANPYDRRKTPGGSSGGEAALIASGASVLGLGSDLVGSIRIPAFYNGIFGHKPTPGMVPVEGHYPIIHDDTFKQFLVLGPMARYAEDLHLAMRILTSKSEIPLRLDEPVNLKNLRILYTDNFDSFCGIRSTTSDIRDTIHKAIRYFSKNGAHVERLSQDWLSSIYYMILATFQELDIPEILVDPKNPEKNRRPILEFFKAALGLSDYTPTLTLVRLIVAARGFLSRSKAEIYINAREELRQKINNTLKDNTVFIYPTFPHPACFPELAIFEFDRTVYTAFANLMLLPSTHVPMGLNNNGMPIGFQVTAASHQDHLCLAIAKELEKAFGGWIPPS